MSDIRHELTICPECHGYGWVEDVDPNDRWVHQVDCGNCEATGLVWKKDIKEEPKKPDSIPLNDDDDLPF